MMSGFDSGMAILQTFIETLRGRFGALPDRRRGLNTTYDMADIAISAFSMFFMQCPSFLNYQRQMEEEHSLSNCKGLFGIAKIPSDNHIRSMLDPIDPTLLYPAFGDLVATLEAAPGGFDTFRRLNGNVLIALDGSEHFCSETIGCRNCLHRERSGGKRENYHAMLGATIVAPGHTQVIPLQPEFIVPQDGAVKQDCENAAAKRWLAVHGAQYARLDPVYLGDDLFSRQPLCEAVLAAAGHFIFVCKPSSHPLIQEYIAGGDLETREEAVRKPGKGTYRHRWRWLRDVPLRNGKDALTVNWFEFEIVDRTGKITYHNSFITDLPVDTATVAELADCGRARWKIENETFNVLKNNGYNLEHNFGHGKQNLASVLVVLNLIAFALHTICDIADEYWKKARAKAVTRQGFFEKLRGTTNGFLVFSSWDQLLMIMIGILRPPPLILKTDPPT
jgi:hypothetical protein